MSNKMASISKTDRRNKVEEVVLRGILSFIEKQNESAWTGTMTNLATGLNRVLSRYQRTLLPNSPSGLRVVINKVVNRLRNRGIGVKFGRTTDHSRTRFVKFVR